MPAMLAEAAAARVGGASAPAPAPAFKFKFGRALHLPVRNVNLRSSRWRKAVGVRLGIKACYTRVPLDTPGAYQLIDNETGEKFIVWGGLENDNQEFPIPSKDVLTWIPSHRKNRRPETTGEGVDQGYSDRQASSFGRLKTQKVRDLVKKSYMKKQEDDGYNFDQENGAIFPTEVTNHSNTQSNLLDKRQSFSGSKDSSETKKSWENSETMKKVSSREDTNHSEVEIEAEGRHYGRSTTYQESDGGSARDRSVSRDSSGSLRGWGNGESMHSYRSHVDDTSDKWHKLDGKSSFFSRKSFKELGCSNYLIESLRSLRFTRPSHIQAMSFGPVIEGKSCIIADQSGSGKTLAYLTPLVQRLREEELQGLSKSVAQNPRVLILVPTAELASQVLSICRSLSKSGVPFRSIVATGGFKQRTQLESLRQELDVLIATPGRFMFLMKEGFLQLSNLKCAVLDEVDILFNDESFELALQRLVNSSSISTQYLFVTATLPVDINKKIVHFFPDCEVVMGPGMHRTSSGLEEILIDCSGDEQTEKSPDTAFLNKKNALLRLVEESPVGKTIIFCNKIETCRKVENALKRFDRQGNSLKVLPFHAALEQETRLANLQEFRSPHSKNTSAFLVCTDRASRGMDFAGVDHVVLFDFPRDPSEYVRRVGRTARGAGGKGKAFIFVVGKQVSLAQRIVERNRKGHPLHDVPSMYDRSLV